jgi:signal transduction histidine kinase
MRKIFLLLLFNLIFSSSFSQNLKNNNEKEALWDQGIPFCPEDPYISGLIDKLSFDSLLINKINVDKNKAKICREIGIAFYNRGMYDAAEWYFDRVKNYVEVIQLEPEKVFGKVEDTKKEEPKKDELSESDIASMKSDISFLNSLPQSYDNMSKDDMRDLAKKIDNQIRKLIWQKDSLLRIGASKELIDSKDGAIKTLKKDKKIIDLTITNDDLLSEKDKIKKYLIWTIILVALLALIIFALLQRKTIKVQDGEIERQIADINKKNIYLEYAARIIRHDMHSGINTYMPRGLSSLQKRIDQEKIEELKIGPSLKMISEGLSHTQKVYKNVYEFTNLVKVKTDFNTTEINLKESLEKYLSNTSYSKQVIIDDLGTIEANEQLICNAIDNLVKNGLKYNKKSEKLVKIYKEVDVIVVEDNGIGLTSNKFEELIKKGIDTESDTGIGLSITKAIVEEHGYSISCEMTESGTKIKIKIKND